MTQSEFNQLVQDVANALANRSNDPGQFELATTLDGISSLPVLWQNGNQWALKRVLISLLKGKDGREVSFQVTSTAIQWKYTNGNWANLITLDKLLQPASSVVSQLQSIINLWNSDTSKKVQEAINQAKAAAANVKDGKTTQFQIGTVAKSAPGGNAAVSLADGGADTNGNPIKKINITVPTGSTGPSPIIEIGTVTTVAAGGSSSASLVANGVDSSGAKKYKLNLALVTGNTGTVQNIANVTLPFSTATSRVNIASGESFATLFGKISLWLSSLKALAFKDKVNWSSDVDGKPTIPTKISQLTNDSGYQTSAQVTAIANQKASKTVHKTATLVVANWVDDTANSEYWKYTISDSAILANSVVVHVPASIADKKKGEEAGIDEYAETTAGKLVIFSSDKPTVNINIKYSIKD